MAKSTFERKFRRQLELVESRRKAYLAEPDSEKNIHDVRVSIRKMDVMFSLFPKKTRKRYSDAIKKYREFLRANSDARDCDIIASKLKTLGAPVAVDLREKKRVKLTRGVRLARSLRKLPAVERGKPDDNRISKVIGRLIDRVKETLPATLSDSSKVEELHRVRRDFRKLRHILDIVSKDDKKKYMEKLEKAMARNVELDKLQDLLGSIHDCDITIEYLRGKGADQILGKEIASRRRVYQKFVTYMRK